MRHLARKEKKTGVQRDFWTLSKNEYVWLKGQKIDLVESIRTVPKGYCPENHEILLQGLRYNGVPICLKTTMNLWDDYEYFNERHVMQTQLVKMLLAEFDRGRGLTIQVDKNKERRSDTK